MNNLELNYINRQKERNMKIIVDGLEIETEREVLNKKEEPSYLKDEPHRELVIEDGKVLSLK